MKYWSKYNLLFKSERFGCFLYNAMSNTFIELDANHYHYLERLAENPDHLDHGIDQEFMDLLGDKHVLVAQGADKRELMVKQYLRNCSCYGKRDFHITICPTLACNFGCNYCFEKSQHQSAVMTDQIIDNLARFLKKKALSDKIFIAWYGGEPTLSFDVIQKTTRRMMDEGLNFESGIVTNGYLLDEKMIQALNDLKIISIQITLDGPREIHDKRRPLKGGQPTYARIIGNIDALMDSSYEGKFSIRVNVDKNNIDTYIPLREELLERYRDKNVFVYASPIKGNTPSMLSSDEWVLFCIELYRRHNIVTSAIFYPHNNISGICVANYINKLVIGPEGEIYKCWEDVGMENKVVGNVCNEEPMTNHELLALYTIGTDLYADNECLECYFLPICAEVCVKKRLESKFFAEKENVYYCTHFKNNLIPCLEEFYDMYITAEISSELLDLAIEPLSGKGYRVIRSEKGTDTPPALPDSNYS